ncbi:hypothetical protein J2Z65_005772 [Paenibacillus aceris]|uniref:Uncharacterized protein n=1 Tax=Paenibacillus aceris TaxID=869555 RepID=A0ABS4I6G6_9BACL|nr:hypothetical protein [Paenibacillus aceris]
MRQKQRDYPVELPLTAIGIRAHFQIDKPAYPAAADR